MLVGQRAAESPVIVTTSVSFFSFRLGQSWGCRGNLADTKQDQNELVIRHHARHCVERKVFLAPLTFGPDREFAIEGRRPGTRGMNSIVSSLSLLAQEEAAVNAA